MRVIHIIPSAFNYFDDIRAEAFKLVENLNSLGVEADAFAMQFSSVSKKEEQEISEIVESQTQKSPPKTEYKGLFNLHKAAESFGDYDIVHVHCPMFGGIGKLLHWKKNNPQIPLVATYYRPVRTPDFFSLFIKLYNLYYLPKIFKLAKIVAGPAAKELDWLAHFMLRKDKEKLIQIDDSAEFMDLDLSDDQAVQLEPREYLAAKYLMVYNSVVSL